MFLDPAHGVSWQQFFDQFVKHGGEWFYGAWSLTYLEPYFQENFGDRYPAGLCNVAEKIQPQLIQLKTNYGDSAMVARQVNALDQTIRYFN